MEHEKIVSIVNDLIIACHDSEEGYKLATQKAENSQLQDVFAQHAAQRGRFAAELSNIVVHELGDPKVGGSLAGKVKRGWLNIKAIISGGDEHAILSEIEGGEDEVVAAYDKALGEKLPANTHEVIQHQYMEIKAAHDQIKRLRDGYVKT